ncbi:MAG: hypothetical protein OXH15_07450 [Gammaproteobacteria bacterium]|nr:hypothetical protein [Gammaproteobacteria bacterium]
MNTKTLTNAREVIDRAMRDFYRDVAFVVIDVSPDIDEDGQEFLWVKAVYDGEPTVIDTRKSLTMVRELRPKLDELEVAAFPVISYVARSDYEEQSA